MLSSAKNLVIDPNDVDMWKLLAQHTKVCTQFNKLIVMCNNCLCSVYIFSVLFVLAYSRYN